jgi:hypothetical protein
MSATSLSPDRIPTGVYNVDPTHTALLRAAAELAPRGVELTLYEGLERLPPYNEDRDTDRPPAEVARLRREIASAQVTRSRRCAGAERRAPGSESAGAVWIGRRLADPETRDRLAGIVAGLVQHHHQFAPAA